MVLAVDVHNVRTHIGIFEGEELAVDWWTETDDDATPDALAADLAGLLALSGLRLEQIDGSIVSSTVPQLSQAWPAMGERYLVSRPLMVGSGLRTGMPIRIEHPPELGANRLVNAVAAYERLGAACVVVDFGTAIAFDVVSGAGEYLGSVFAPGLDISFERLTARAAGLPNTALSRPAAAIGTSTVAALNSGAVYGAAGICEGIVARIATEMEEKPTVLATGPRAELIADFCDTIERVEPALTLEGLRIIHLRNS